MPRKRKPLTLDLKAPPTPKDLVLPAASPTTDETYREWHARVAPKLLDIGQRIVQRLDDNIEQLPPALLLQYLQQIQSFVQRPAVSGPSTVHNHQHLHVGRSKEEILAILERKTGLSSRRRGPKTELTPAEEPPTSDPA
mgnify:CR=1 FL=1